MTDGFRVMISPVGWDDPLMQSTSIWISSRYPGSKPKVMKADGTWVEVEEGAHVDPTLTFPSEVMEALAEAVDRYRGQPSHAKTESAVLREWLAAERERVDMTLKVTLAPHLP